jgi:adenylate cyclase
MAFGPNGQGRRWEGYDADEPPDRRMRLRVGINIGDAIPDGTDLHGDGVNAATRLEALCPVGGICVSRSVRDHVHGRLNLSFEPFGTLTLKNIARPAEAFVLRLGQACIASGPAGWQISLRPALLAGGGGLERDGTEGESLSDSRIG